MTLSQALKKQIEKDQPTEENLNEWEIELYHKISTKNLEKRKKQ